MQREIGIFWWFLSLPVFKIPGHPKVKDQGISIFSSYEKVFSQAPAFLQLVSLQLLKSDFLSSKD